MVDILQSVFSSHTEFINAISCTCCCNLCKKTLPKYEEILINLNGYVQNTEITNLLEMKMNSMIHHHIEESFNEEEHLKEKPKMFLGNDQQTSPRAY
jgi:hypothetical protein